MPPSGGPRRNSQPDAGRAPTASPAGITDTYHTPRRMPACQLPTARRPRRHVGQGARCAPVPLQSAVWPPRRVQVDRQCGSCSSGVPEARRTAQQCGAVRGQAGVVQEPAQYLAEQVSAAGTAPIKKSGWTRPES